MNSGSKDGSSDNIFFHQLMKNHSPRGPPYKRLKNRRGIIINRTCHVTPILPGDWLHIILAVNKIQMPPERAAVFSDETTLTTFILLWT